MFEESKVIEHQADSTKTDDFFAGIGDRSVRKRAYQSVRIERDHCFTS